MCGILAVALKLNASLMVMAFRGWQALAGAFTLILSISFLTPEELGLFQTMTSVVAFFMILDVGLSTVLVQLSAARFNGACWDGVIVGSGAVGREYLSLCKFAFIWYAVVGVLFMGVLPAGLVFFCEEAQLLFVDWIGPWAMLVIASALQMVLMPVLSVLEGAGQIFEVYAIRLLQVVVGAVAVWGVLLFGGNLWAVAMLPTGSVVVCVFWVIVRRWAFIVQVLKADAVSAATWVADVWPLQWRAAFGWLAGYSLVLIHVPILFVTQGAIAAGQMGVTMTVVNVLSVLAMSYPVAKVPSMVMLSSRQDWRAVDELFSRVWRISIGMYLLGALIVLLLMLVLQGWPVSARFLALEQTALLLLGMAAYHMASVFGIFIRAHLQDPLFKVAIGCAILTAILSYWASRYWGSLGNIFVILAVNGGGFLPLTFVVLRKMRGSRLLLR